MNNVTNRSIQLTAVIGAVLISILVIIMSFSMFRGSAVSTDQAVERVSEFYLRELADRRAQVISSLIDTKVDQMQRAMQVISKEDLESVDSLRSFIGEIQTLYALDVLALADEDNVVYSRYSTYMGGSRYDFLSQDLSFSAPVISTINLYGGSKHICIVIPLKDLSFQGKDLKVCFVEIDIETFAQSLAFGTEKNDTWFGLYYRTGENLTSIDFGPFDAGQNLLSSMKDTLNEDEWNSLKNDFETGEQGEAVFRYSSDLDTLYYLPVRDTGWMMTVLISGELIQDQVRGISDELLKMGMRFFILIGLALVVYFLLLYRQLHRRSSTLLKKEQENKMEIARRAEKSESELGVYKGLANKDPLTGVQSKLAYMEKVKMLDAEIQAASVSGLAILVGDLNGLKHINDTAGHAAGDEYLKAGAMMLCRQYQHSPVYRTGGDEFVVVLQNTDYEHRKELLEQLNQQVEKNIGTDGVVISVGMSDFTPEDGAVKDIFTRADHLMYERKKQLKEMGAHARD